MNFKLRRKKMKKKKKSEKTSVRSKDIRSTLKTVPIPSKHSQVLELIEID